MLIDGPLQPSVMTVDLTYTAAIIIPTDIRTELCRVQWSRIEMSLTPIGDAIGCGQSYIRHWNSNVRVEHFSQYGFVGL